MQIKIMSARTENKPQEYAERKALGSEKEEAEVSGITQLWCQQDSDKQSERPLWGWSAGKQQAVQANYLNICRF